MRKILSIDGGGIRGIIPAMVLKQIEEKTGRDISDLFDLIAGTSTGGIIAVCLCKHDGDDRAKFGPRSLLDLYGRRGHEIFYRSLWHSARSVGGLADEKYPHNNLEAILEEYLGDTLLGTALTNLLITSYDIESRQPFFFKSWRPEFADVPMRHAARATSAAPTYFEPAVVTVDDGHPPHALVDGGVCVNNPAMCAYAEARRLWPDEEILVVSLGTGEATRPIPYSDARDWGLLEWAAPVLSVMMDGMVDAVDYQLRTILENRYFRFQGRLETANDDMDDVTRRNIAALRFEAGRIMVAQRRDIDLVSRLLVT